ncbi:hypothetical protein [Kribbella endophytica]
MTDDRSSKHAARRLAQVEGSSYTAAQRRLIDAGYWGRGQRFFDDLLNAHVPGRPLPSLDQLADNDEKGEL